MEMKYVKKQEALEFYGISYRTLYEWRKKGKIKCLESANGKRFEYLYGLDYDLRNSILVMKQFDKRWK